MAEAGPRAAVDVVVELEGSRIALIRRRYPPEGWAIPGGFIELGESAEAAAVREAREELGMAITLCELFHVYSDPDRDPRRHTLSIVFLARANGAIAAGDDATEARGFTEADLPVDLAFDHARILNDYFRYRRTGQRPGVQAQRLSEEDKSILLTTARHAIGAALRGSEEPGIQPESGPLSEHASVFVGLHRHGELRGCIGSFARDRSLWTAVRDMAVAAAFEDPRFDRLAAGELADLEIEISVLSQPRRVEVSDVTPGVHGVSLARGDRKAVFLPQVAVDAGWDRETLLEETCLKAGLPRDAWRDPATEVAVFTAEWFGEAPSGAFRKRRSSS